MPEESQIKRAFSVAGLLAGVGLAWALLLMDGSMDGDWLFAGFLALGLGVLALNAVDRLIWRIFAVGVEREKSGPVAKNSVSEDEEATPAPRLRVLMISSGLEALAAALLAAHYTGSVVISVAAGVLTAGLAIAVSVLLARKLSPVSVTSPDQRLGKVPGRSSEVAPSSRATPRQ
jgi:hypothetical protein